VRNSNPPIGAIAYGQSGVGGIITRYEADRVVLRLPDGLKRVPIDAIDRWELPAPSVKLITQFQIDDRVRYTGSNRHLQQQYAGELTIWEISKCDDGYACLKPDGRVTSWILFKDLEPLTDIPSPLATVTQPPRRISIGDEVTIRSTQQRGRIALWYRNRSKAVIEFEDNTLSDWVPSSELVRISDGAIEATPNEPLSTLSADWKPTIALSDDEGEGLMEVE
jgi:hypothetical protein